MKNPIYPTRLFSDKSEDFRALAETYKYLCQEEMEVIPST